MEWIKNLFEKIFHKSKIAMLSAPIACGSNDYSNDRKSFQHELKMAANPELDEGNGYGIILYSKLEDSY